MYSRMERARRSPPPTRSTRRTAVGAGRGQRGDSPSGAFPLNAYGQSSKLAARTIERHALVGGLIEQSHSMARIALEQGLDPRTVAARSSNYYATRTTTQADLAHALSWSQRATMVSLDSPHPFDAARNPCSRTSPARSHFFDPTPGTEPPCCRPRDRSLWHRGSRPSSR